MLERYPSVDVYPMSERATAFLAVLEMHMDSPVTRDDLLEAYPQLNWNEKVADTWNTLTWRPELQDRLISAGDNATRIYALLSKENDLSLLERRTNFMEEYYVKYTSERPAQVWRKRAAAVAALVGVVSTGVALGVHYKRRSSN